MCIYKYLCVHDYACMHIYIIYIYTVISIHNQPILPGVPVMSSTCLAGSILTSRCIRFRPETRGFSDHWQSG